MLPFCCSSELDRLSADPSLKQHEKACEGAKDFRIRLAAGKALVIAVVGRLIEALARNDKAVKPSRAILLDLACQSMDRTRHGDFCLQDILMSWAFSWMLLESGTLIAFVENEEP